MTNVLYCKSLWIKASTKCPECKMQMCFPAPRRHVIRAEESLSREFLTFYFALRQVVWGAEPGPQTRPDCRSHLHQHRRGSHSCGGPPQRHHRLQSGAAQGGERPTTSQRFTPRSGLWVTPVKPQAGLISPPPLHPSILIHTHPFHCYQYSTVFIIEA